MSNGQCIPCLQVLLIRTEHTHMTHTHKHTHTHTHSLLAHINYHKYRHTKLQAQKHFNSGGERKAGRSFWCIHRICDGNELVPFWPGLEHECRKSEKGIERGEKKREENRATHIE